MYFIIMHGVCSDWRKITVGTYLFADRLIGHKFRARALRIASTNAIAPVSIGAHGLHGSR